jgi:hypothetical protein
MVGGDEPAERWINAGGEVSQVKKEGEMAESPLILEDGKYTDAAAHEEAFEKVAVGAGVVEDAGDEKAGEGKEEIDSGPASKTNCVYQVQQQAAMGSATVVEDEDHGDGEGTDSI